MTKSLTLSGLQMLQVRLGVDQAGTVRVFGEYYLKSGAQVIQVKNTEITGLLSASQQQAAATLFSGATQQLTALELG